MAQGLGLDEIINITTTVQAGGTIRTEFGTGLLLTTSTAIPAGGPRKCQYFRNSAAVSSVFGSDPQVLNDSGVWFQADPAPKALYIGRWAESAVNTRMVSGVVDATQSEIDGISNGSFVLGGNEVTGIDFTSGTNGDSFPNIANYLQDRINSISSISGATVSYSSTTKRFTIDFGTTDDVGAFTSLASPGTDLTTLFRLETAEQNATGDDIATYDLGSDSETVEEALNRCVALATAGAPVAIMMAGDMPATYGSSNTSVVSEVSAFAQKDDYMYSFIETSTGALTANESTSTLASAFAGQRSHVIPVYSRGATPGERYGPRPDIGILAKLSSQSFDLPSSIITLVPKTLPGVNTSTVTSTQLNELERKRANVYTTVGGLPTLLGGTTARTGVWADAQYWLFWLKNEMERSIFEAMRSSKRLSNATLTDTINDVMSKAVRSGGANPGGKVSNSIRDDIRRATGNHEFDGVLQNGFVLWIDPPQDQTDADRAARVSRFTVWVAPSEAIHTVTGAIILSG